MEPYIAIDDARDKVYVTDPTKHRVHIFTTAGKFISHITQDAATNQPLSTPVGVGVDKETGKVYVTDMTANKLYILQP